MSFLEKLKKNTGIKEKIKEKEKKKEEPSSKQKIEAQLSVDVYETKASFVIQSTVAGVKAKDLDISAENGVLTIRGAREKPDREEEKKYFYQECYWGGFSRQITLPGEIDGSKIEAKMKDGVLTLNIPKVVRKRKKKIVIEDEE